MTSKHPAVRQVDWDALARLGPGDRVSQKLLSAANGAVGVSVSLVRTPPGGGSPEGLHFHEVEQVFYVVKGVMTIEVAGERSECGPGSLVVFPPRTPHRNWNDSGAETLHLNICAPAPDPSRPFATRLDG